MKPTTNCFPTPDRIYRRYNKMIMKIAHTMSKKFNKPFDELYAEAMYHVLTRIQEWNPKRGGLCTHVYNCAYFHTWNYCKPEREIPHESDNPTFVEQETKPNWFKNFLNELSEETQQLVKIIFEAPEELYETVKPNCPKLSKKAIRNYMIDAMDWDEIRIEKSFAEIRQCL